MTASAADVAARPLPGARSDSREVAWWGIAMLVVTESTIFAILLASYFFLRATTKQWPIGDIELPELRLSLPFSVVLWASSAPVVWAERAIRKGRTRHAGIGLAAAFAMGLAFTMYSLKDFHDLHYGWRDNAYASMFYVIVGLHLAHVVVGLGMSTVVQVKVWTGRVSADHHVTLKVFGLYWHFVDAVWLVVFPSVFLSPRWR